MTSDVFERPARGALLLPMLAAFAGAMLVLPATAASLFEDDFGRGIPGWTVVQPSGAYSDGPQRWEYDIVSGGFVEQSNIFTDSPTASPTATTPMLINATLTAVNFTYSARLTAGDDDGFGLIFGYQNETNFYRVTFARQSRTGYPWTGWSVDRKVNGVTVNLFGGGTPGYVQTFVNTAGRPFDVTISVDTSDRLSLTVVDNPTATPVNYPLVASQQLPTPANGRVGLMTWGMSGGVPRGFRIQNVNLAPAALTDHPNALTNWTALVPPRANGSTAVASGHGQPLWALGFGLNGPFGTLRESGDCFGGNDAAGQVDFTGPTLVAGNTEWTNYTVAARITPGDDDAHGILLRYQDATNFYRISLRSQASAIGAPRGLAIQKSVNRAYSEVYRETTVQYDPVAGTTYDLVASILGDQLQVLLVSDPEGAAIPFTYGPVPISGINSGKIGLFSWAMEQTEYDWVKVEDGAPLYVSSSFGSPSPAKGLTGFAPGTLVTASVTPGVDRPGVRHIADGWRGSGSVPASGSGSNVVFTINMFSRLHWLWRIQYLLSVTNTEGGTVSTPPGDWLDAGTNVNLTAYPNPGFLFTGWVGDVASTAAGFTFAMNGPVNVKATFAADADGDLLPDSWELGAFGSLDQVPGGDFDGDGRTNAQEYAQGTHPAVPDVLRIDGLQIANGLGLLSVSNNSGSRYSVERMDGLAGNWTTIAQTQFVNVYTSPLPAANSAFWRLRQPGRPAEALPFVPGSWTLVVLPDTQIYAMSHPAFFQDQTRWIVQNRDRYNIKYVLHLGDITNNNLTNQWQNAWEAMSLMDGVIPYAFVPGNHDYGATGGTENRNTFLNDYFPVANYTNWPTFGGIMEPGKMDNSYHLFSAGGTDWLVLALEFAPRNSVVAWANSVLDAHPDRKTILITHAYLYDDDTRYDWAAKGPAQLWNPHAYGVGGDSAGVNDGEELWQKLVKVRRDVPFVFNGHVLHDGLGRLSSTNDFGQVVHQMLVNYQMQPLGGEAYLRLVEFLPDGKTVQVKAYSPMTGGWKTDSQNQFVLLRE